MCPQVTLTLVLLLVCAGGFDLGPLGQSNEGDADALLSKRLHSTDAAFDALAQGLAKFGVHSNNARAGSSTPVPAPAPFILSILTTAPTPGPTPRLCQPGTFVVMQVDGGGCAPCPPGKYQHLRGVHACFGCPQGKFQLGYHAVRCGPPGFGKMKTRTPSSTAGDGAGAHAA